LEKLSTPLILINCKTYREGLGEKARVLAKKAMKVSQDTGVCIALAPQFTDIESLTKTASIPIFAQHIDPIEPGSKTGHILAEAIKDAGAVGSIVNHSERRLRLADIENSIARLKALDLISVVCTNNARVSVAAAMLEPNFVAIEPPELIGTGIPVSKAKPEIVTETVDLVKQANPRTIILCGAGITKGDDVLSAIKLGAKGVLVASGVVKAEDPYKVLLDFAHKANAARG
jgi:triosephosphate isomerase